MPKGISVAKRGSWFWRDLDCHRNYPGWNLTADTKGCLFLLALLDLREDADWSSSKSIVPASLPTPLKMEFQRPFVPNQWTLRCRKNGDDETWTWDGDRSAPRLTCSQTMIVAIGNAVHRIANGEGDFRVGVDAQRQHDEAKQCPFALVLAVDDRLGGLLGVSGRYGFVPPNVWWSPESERAACCVLVLKGHQSVRLG